MQAIKTKYLGPTDTRGARIKASCDAGSLTVAWDYAGNADTNHYAAQLQLRLKLGWVTKAEPVVCGWIGNECFWVCK